MAFFMESTFVGLMIFGWERLTKAQHLIVTYFVALGSNLSALWILIANSFMQDPRGAHFNPLTMRMELDSFMAMLFSPDAQSKFVHTSIAGYVTAAIFVAGSAPTTCSTIVTWSWPGARSASPHCSVCSRLRA